MKTAEKSSQNPFFHSTYADLASVWEACRKPLSDNGLSVTQLISKDGEKQILETVLFHSSGQYISSTLVLTPKDDTPQAIGSSITYARRYSLAAIVGVSSDDDDDGEAAEGRTAPDKRRQEPEAPKKVDTTSPYYCAKHNTLWFKGGKMKAYAHPVEGSSAWCSIWEVMMWLPFFA